MPGDRNGHPFTGLTSLLRHPNHLNTRSNGVDIPFCSSFGRLALYYSVFNVRNLGFRINSEKDVPGPIQWTLKIPAIVAATSA